MHACTFGHSVGLLPLLLKSLSPSQRNSLGILAKAYPLLSLWALLGLTHGCFSNIYGIGAWMS